MTISFRRRSRVNWLGLIALLVLVIGGGWLLYQYLGIPSWLQTMPFVPRTPTPTPVVVDDGSATMALGEQLLQAGRLGDAVAAFEETAKTAANGAAELRQVAAEFARQEKPADSAIKTYQAGKAAERASMAHARISRILALRGWNTEMTTRAVAEARKALELDANNADARAVLVLAFDRNSQYDSAIQAGKEATDLDKTNAEAFSFLAEAYADKAPLDPRARESALTALRLNDRSPYAHRNYGYVLETEGDYAAAAGEYLNAIALAPAFSPLYLDLGRVYYMRLNKYDEAIAALRRATELDPGNPQAFTELGRWRPQRPASGHQRRIQLCQCSRVPGMGLLLRPASVRQGCAAIPEGSGAWPFHRGTRRRVLYRARLVVLLLGQVSRGASRLPEGAGPSGQPARCQHHVSSPERLGRLPALAIAPFAPALEGGRKGIAHLPHTAVLNNLHHE
jgi:tetratricopeptide (TPR) repeat protein